MSLLGVVLAGGRSSRMGQDKAMLIWQGETLLERQSQLLKKAGCDAVLIAGRQAHGWPSLPDDKPFRGPVAALAHILTNIEGMFALIPGRMVLVPVDMPLLMADHLTALLQHAAPLIAYEGNPFPCAMSVTPALRQTVVHYALRPQASLKGLWGMVAGSVWLPQPASAEFLTNINTPEEWQRLQTLAENKNV